MAILSLPAFIAKPVPDSIVKEAESAWWLGFTLGLEWEEAGPSAEFTPFQADAFLDGWETGRREAEMDRLAWSDTYDAQTLRERMEFDALVERAFPEYDSWPEQELAECFGTDTGKGVRP